MAEEKKDICPFVRCTVNLSNRFEYFYSCDCENANMSAVLLHVCIIVAAACVSVQHFLFLLVFW